jgi:ParB family transcriptional regulator, chromosome partitioning protein
MKTKPPRASGYARPVTPTMQVEQIQVGPRVRKNNGDIDSLAASIRQIGLLHPIPVTPAGVLVAGGRRLEVVKLLGWKEVPVHVVRDLDDLLLMAERDENVCRSH